MFVLTRLHEVVVHRRRPVTERLVHDDVIQPEVARLECVTWPGGDTVVEEISLAHSMIDEETQDVRGEVQRQHDEVNPVVAVEKVDT